MHKFAIAPDRGGNTGTPCRPRYSPRAPFPIAAPKDTAPTASNASFGYAPLPICCLRRSVFLPWAVRLSIPFKSDKISSHLFFPQKQPRNTRVLGPIRISHRKTCSAGRSPRSPAAFSSSRFNRPNKNGKKDLTFYTVCHTVYAIQGMLHSIPIQPNLFQ